jgi:uncharacterized protein
MKFLLVFAVVLIAFFIWRSGRAGAKAPPPAKAPPQGETRSIEMVRCDACGLHCPKTDSVAGKRGVYCTAQHRQQAEP